MGIFAFNGKSKTKQDDSLPWEGGESIYGYIKKSMDSDTGRLKDSAENLPDDEKIFAPGEMRWVAGFMEGVFRVASPPYKD